MYQWPQTQPYDVQREEGLNAPPAPYSEIILFNQQIAPEPSMEADKAIAELGASLDAWFDGSAETFASQDRKAQGNAIHRGVEIIKQFDRLKANGKAAINILLDRSDATEDNERGLSLIRAFEFGARLGHALYDEFLDTEGKNEIWHLLDAIVLKLDKVGVGRGALEVLFDSADAGVRAAAGAYLIDLMPDRVIPMLRDIDDAGGGNSADFGAHWALLAWERERKSRFNYLTG